MSKKRKGIGIYTHTHTHAYVGLISQDSCQENFISFTQLDFFPGSDIKTNHMKLPIFAYYLKLKK